MFNKMFICILLLPNFITRRNNSHQILKNPLSRQTGCQKSFYISLRIFSFRKFSLFSVFCLKQLSKMRINRNGKLRKLKQFHMQRNRRKPLLCSHYMSCSHKRIISQMSHMISRITI